MAQGHDRLLTRWVRAYGLKRQGVTPPVEDLIVPVTLVDDATNLAPPLESPAGMALADPPAVAAVFAIVEFTPPPGGAIFQWQNITTTVGVNCWLVRGAGTQITANLQTLASPAIEPPVSILGRGGVPCQALVQQGTATVDPDTAFGQEGGNWDNADVPMPPIYIPGDRDYMVYLSISNANIAMQLNLQWSEFGPV